MPRPKLYSDQVILDAAKAVLKVKGPSDFTLNDVAIEAGISRAALIQRYTNRDKLLRSIMERSVEQTREHLENLPVECSIEGLKNFLDELCEVMGDGTSFETNLLIAWHEARDPELKRLSQIRFTLVREALAKRIPQNFALSPDEGAKHLQCVIGGSAMQWLVITEGRLDEYMKKSVNIAVEIMIRKHPV